MSKIVQAINAMISNQKLITKVQKSDGEIFFLYKKKYKWSMRNNETGLLLYFYPSDEPLESLSSRGDEWEGVPMVVYSAKDLNTVEAYASFNDLYTVLNERVYGVNDVLDDIIASDGF